MNPIRIVLDGINDHLLIKGLLSRLKKPATANTAFCIVIKDVLESMGQIMNVLKKGGFQKKFPKPVFELSPRYAHLPNGFKFVYPIIVLLFEGMSDVIKLAPNREREPRNLRPFRSELPADGQISRKP